MTIVELSCVGKDQAAVLSLIEELNQDVEVKTYDNGKDIDVNIRAKDPREIAIKFFTLFLNHPYVTDMRFKRK